MDSTSPWSVIHSERREEMVSRLDDGEAMLEVSVPRQELDEQICKKQ